jgi:hypothetical protein
LVDKLHSREVVSHPSNAGNGDKEELQRKDIKKEHNTTKNKSHTISFRFKEVCSLMLKNSEYIGTVKNASSF